MHLNKSSTRFILIGIYVLALWVRVDASGGNPYPYFKGESGTHYRHAELIANDGKLPPVDKRANWPDGYAPARAGATGVEYAVGFGYRVVSFFSDMPLRNFARLFTIFVFCLSVFPLYLLTQRLWHCQAAGLLTAVLLAMSAPLVAVTDGTEFLHAPFAFLLVTAHLSLFVGYRARASTVKAILGALTVAALLGTWEGAPYYVAFWTLIVLAVRPKENVQRLLLTHAFAVLLASILLPHLRAQRFMVTWPAIFLFAAAAWTFVSSRLPRRFPDLAYIGLATGGATLLLEPFRAGATGVPPLAAYGFARLRFLFDKPDDASLLAETVRALWTRAHTYPTHYTVLQFFLPIVVLLPLAILNIRQMKKTSDASDSRPIGLAVTLAVAGIVFFAIDRGAVFAAALGVYPLAAASVYAFGRHMKTRLLPVGLAMLIFVIQPLFPFGAMNPTYRLARRLGAQPAAPDGFLWASLGNADQDLVRFVVARTSVKDAFLAPPEISSLLMSFAGRKTVLTPGIYTENSLSRRLNYVSQYYSREQTLYESCRALGIKYVVYSIDYLLDESKYSPRYLAGVSRVEEHSLTFQMHFAPQHLDHFRLIYENDNYRLFSVTDEPALLFLTDHPPVYQQRIIKSHFDSLGSFYTRVIGILATYHAAIALQLRGDDEEATRRLRYCLDQAPRFTKAWLAVGESMLRLGEPLAANAAYMKVLEYAPDNGPALYAAALTYAQTDATEAALDLLDVLQASIGDRDILRQAMELRATIESTRQPANQDEDKN